MDWVHCNVCFYRPGQQPKREFFVTSCGHVVCKFCDRSSQEELCRFCAGSCSIIVVSNQMEQNVRTFFEETDSYLQKALKIMEFQNKHRMQLFKYLTMVWEKYQRLKLSYQQEEQKSNKLEEKANKLEEENKKLKRELEQYRNQRSVMPSPITSPNIPLLSRISQESQVRMQSQLSGMPNSPFFVTPTRSVQNYRSQNTPSTPMSDINPSPLSVASSQQSYRSGGIPRSNNQRVYRPGLTPPLRSMSLLSVHGHNARDASPRF